MTKSATDALELLQWAIPGAYFDKSFEGIVLNQQSNILLMVDGTQQPISYLKHLSPRRVKSVEVFYSLSGMLISDDYAYIINFKLNKDSGFDIYASNATSLNLSRTATNNSRIAKNSPFVSCFYPTRKLNIFGSLEYNNENSNIPFSKNVLNNTTELVSDPSTNLNNLYNQKNLIANSFVHYNITSRHLLGIQADFVSGNTYTFQEFAMKQTELTNNYNQNPTILTEKMLKAYTITSKLFYRGQVTNRLQIYSDISYNYYYNNFENDYLQTSQWTTDSSYTYKHSDLWSEYKNQTVINLEGKYKLFDKMSVEAGYSNIRRQYASNIYQKVSLDYSEYRNKAFIYLYCYLSDKIELKFGSASEYIRQRNSYLEKNDLQWLPYFHINYKFNRIVNLYAGYATSQSYPLLYQLSPMSIVVYSFLTQIGNPSLLSTVRHQAFAEISLYNKLKILPQFNFIRNGISEIYNDIGNHLYRTFDNVNFREYRLHLSYDQPIGAYFNLKNTVMLYQNEVLHEDIHNSLNGWTCHFEGDYYHPLKSFGVQLGYYRNMKKSILWQGYQMSDKDYWCVTARKNLRQNRITVTMSYIPPIAFGVRYHQTKSIDTHRFKEKTDLNLQSYNQMLLIKVSLRLDRSGSKNAVNQILNSINERER